MSDQAYGEHYSVLYSECLEALKAGVADPETTIIFGDMTFGAGGHTTGLANLFENSKVYAVDQDPDAIENGLKLISEKGLSNKIELIKTNYIDFPDWIEKNNPSLRFNGILMDLGVSSHQFDTISRGFSFRAEAPLDMRMDYTNDEFETAEFVLNNYAENEIADILFKYGEERLSRRIAAEIVSKRKQTPLKSTKDLEDICFHCYPKKERFKKTHPATRSFQALRIYVNKELEVLEKTIEKLFGILKPGGTLAIISFHSLEDRIVKHKFKEIFQTEENTAKILTKKPILPTEQEIDQNKRSRSAKLRVIQKVDGITEDLSGKKKGKKKSSEQFS